MQQNNQLNQNNSHADTVSIVDYLLVLAKQKKLIIAVTLIATCVAAISTFFMKPIYLATTLILPPQKESGLISSMLSQLSGVSGLAGELAGKGTNSELYLDFLRSETIRDPIIDRFNLKEVYGSPYRDQLYKIMDFKGRISASRKTGVITITVEDGNPQRAADMANAYVEELIKFTSNMSTMGASNNRAFFEQRLAEAKTNLVKTENNLKAFQSKYKAFQVPEQAQATIQGIAQMKAQLAVQEVQLATLRSQFTDTSQEVKTVKSSINNLKAQIAKLEHGTSVGALPSLGVVPELGQEYIRNLRAFKTDEMIVEMLTKQFEMSKLSEANNVSNIQVVQKAKVPERKSKPSKKKIVMAAFVFSFAISIALAFVMENIAAMADDDRQKWCSLFNRFKFNLIRLNKGD